MHSKAAYEIPAFSDKNEWFKMSVSDSIVKGKNTAMDDKIKVLQENLDSSDSYSYQALSTTHYPSTKKDDFKKRSLIKASL